VSSPRSYCDGCGIARALDLVGERWALLVVRELLLGPKRFTDLRAGLPAASPNVLTQRLRELEERGIVRRRKLPPPAPARLYELTEWGRELEGPLLALGRWGARSEPPPEDASVPVDAVILALKSMFDPAAAGDLAARFELRLDEQVFRLEVADGRIEVERGAASSPDAVIETAPDTLSAVVFEGRPVDDLRIEGDREAVARLVGLFPLPAAA
jgi:DNA-binding HxlR family transcriptional regulator